MDIKVNEISYTINLQGIQEMYTQQDRRKIMWLYNWQPIEY